MSDFYIRQSEIKSWKTCRRRTNWGYRQQLVPVSHSGGTKAGLGTMVHRALETHYRGDGSPLGEIEFIGKLLLSEDPQRYEDERKNLDLAHIMVKGYLEWAEDTGIDAGVEVVGVERQIVVPFMEVNGDTIFVTGKVDLEIIDMLGRRGIIDHKTVQGISMGMTLPFDDQLLTYAVLRRMEGDQIDFCAHNQLRRVKRTTRSNPPYYGRQEVRFNKQQLDSHEATLRYILHEMYLAYNAGSDTVFYANPSRDCDWACDFKAVCPMRDDGSDWEGFLSEHFTTGDRAGGIMEEEL